MAEKKKFPKWLYNSQEKTILMRTFDDDTIPDYGTYLKIDPSDEPRLHFLISDANAESGE